jgi:acid phosphatase class B
LLGYALCLSMIKNKTKAFVFDFDDTLAFTDAKVHVMSEQNECVASLTPQGFNDAKLKDGQWFDFSDFDKSSFILNGTPTKLIDLAKDVFNEGHSVFILTARTSSASSAIAEFLGHNFITAKEIHCVGSQGSDIAKSKRKVLLSIIENFDEIWFFDDDERNIQLAKDLPLTAKKV